jgi:phenylacetate-CoA ligase
LTAPASVGGRVRATLAIARRAVGQRQIPFLPDEERHRMRDARVRALVRYAADTVPHYRDLFRAEGIEPGDIRTASDLERLPLLDRGQLDSDPDRFVSTSPQGRESVVFPTNGTTGTPLAIRHDQPSMLANVAYGERERVVEARLSGQRLRYVVVDVNYGPRDTGYQLLRFYRDRTIIPLRPARHMLRLSEPFERTLHDINRLRPAVLQGYGSYLEAFFGWLQDRDADMHLPKLVLYGSDTMTPPGRLLVEKRFGIPVISRYNAVEAFKIGFTCEARDGVHVEDDLCHVRVVDGAERPAPPGALGEVVISNLVNHGTVLLNYRLGDLAAWSETPCACGRSTPRLSDVEGRLETTLRLPGGRFVPEGAVQVLLKDLGLVTFQLVQVEPTRYRLKLMAAMREQAEQALPGALTDLRGLLGEGATVEPSFHEHLEAGPRGVFRYVFPMTAYASPPPPRSAPSGTASASARAAPWPAPRSRESGR